MKKITLAIFVVFCLLGAKSPAAASPGPGLGVILGEPVGLSAKFGNFPVVGFSWSFAGRLNATIDMWFVDRDLIEPLHWHLGVGVSAHVKFNMGNTNAYVFGAGVRIPVGLQWWISPELELFLEVTPGMSLSTDPNAIIGPDMGGGIGIRYYLDI